MKPLLRGAGLAVLQALTRSKAMLAFDYDGTLAPIVADRDRADMRATTRALLKQACERFPTAIISGRARDDVRSYLRGVHAKYVVGNHGLDRGHESLSTVAALDEARARLAILVSRWPGTELEDKRYSLSVHYRRSRRKAEFRGAVLSLLEKLSTPIRIVPGKCVLNVVLEGTPHKGDALLALTELEGVKKALYVGDDATDEDVFRLGCHDLLVTVRVGKSKSSAAQWFLETQEEIDALLSVLSGRG